jgi:hypothetical protein
MEALANPMEKVIELLDVLAKQIDKEGKEDAVTYKAYVKFYQNQTGHGEKIIKENANKISQLSSDLKEAEAFREGKNKDLVDLANKLSKNDAELSAGRKGRAKERSVFEKNEAVFIESLDQLDRALKVMAKKAPAAASASASLLTVAQRLKSTLTSGSDFSLSTAQRETLDSFMRQAQMSSEQGSPVPHERKHRQEAAPSFLQQGSHSRRGPYGEYQSKGGGLISTLQDLQTKVKKERDDGLKAEEKLKKDFKELDEGLVTMLENGKKSLADIKSSIAQSQEQSAQKQASLMEAKEIYKVEVEHMEGVEAEFRGKTQAYKVRLGKRSDEAIAVHEAQRIMSSEMAKSYIKGQTVGNVKGAASFIQMSQEKNAARRKVIHLFKTAQTPGLALVALRSTVHIRHGADPFAKVKTMIQGMLKKLQDKQAQESRHAAWCDHEMGKTTQAQKRKEEDVQKMKDRLDALDAELTQTKADIDTISGDLKDMTEAMAGAQRIREKEHAQATKSMKQFKDAAALLTRATKVLKAYYKNKAGGGSEVDKKEFKQRHGMGTGIIGILEIAIDDFKKLYADTKEAEEAAAKDFKEQQNESQVRSAVFQKDLEWKSRTKVKMEFDQATMTNDLKSYEKEKTAIDNYMEKLKASCIVKGPSYAEKKERREAELRSLKEAMSYLSSQSR